MNVNEADAVGSGAPQAHTAATDEGDKATPVEVNSTHTYTNSDNVDVVVEESRLEIRRKWSAARMMVVQEKEERGENDGMGETDV